ncbi:TPA: glycosyltransferase, partial [Streptococcus suis]
MIFVTVGTHEQQFNRLIKEIDLLKKNGSINDEIFIQTGFSTYEPKYCTWKNLLSYSEMEDYMLKADIVVTHGGPASFMDAMSKGKTTIVVPRQKKYGEHVNDHQLEFCKKIVEKGYELTMVKDVS